MLGSRMITALIAIAFLVVILLSDQIVLLCAGFLITELLLFELFKATGILKKGPLTLVGFLPPIMLFAASNQMALGGFMFLYIILLFSLMVFKRDVMDIGTVSVIFFLSFSVTYLFSHVITVRQLPFIGKYAVWAIFVGACMSDTFAYFVGSVFGKRKLAPEISPKKTVEGSIGAVAGTIISMLIYGAILDLCFDFSINYLNLIILSVLCSVFAQMGDLSASVVKRMCRIRDFGSIFPGHGGFMDRFDSILFVAPAVFYSIAYIPWISLI